MIDLKRASRQVSQQRSRAKLLGITNTLTLAEWVDILELSNGVCVHCQKNVGTDALTVEHNIAVSNGGGNTKENIRAMCRRCNIRKGNRSSPHVQKVSATRINEEELLVVVGAYKIHMFDSEVRAFIDILERSINSIGMATNATDTTPKPA